MATHPMINPGVESARQMLCEALAKWCEDGVNTVKVRVNLQADQPESVWVYGHQDNQWQKQDLSIETNDDVVAIYADMERLAKSPFTEECQTRRKELGDRVEFELRFHGERLAEHQGQQLTSYLYGILFIERHDAPDPGRMTIKRGMRQRGVRN